MKKRLLTTSWLMLLASVFAITTMAQDVTVEVANEGGLWDALEAKGITDFTTIKNLKVTGVLGENDFKLIKNQMSNLERIDIADINIKEIPSGAFASKENLKSARLPEGITTIKDNTFNNCILLESVTFGSQTAEAGKIVFPASLRNIGSNAFASCQLLTSIDFSACTSLECIDGYAFENCEGLTLLDFSACTSLSRIESGALRNLHNLKEVILPSKGNLYLGWQCFYVYDSWDAATEQYVYKGLEVLTLTKAVTYLESECLPRTLKTLYVESSTPPSCSGNFINNVSTSLKVYVPNGSKREYAIADGWSNLYQYMQELGFKVNITGYGMVQKGSSYYGNGDVFFTNQGSTTTLKVVPEVGCELLSVKLDGNAVNVAADGTFTIPATSTIGTLDIAFSANPFTVDNPNGGELKDLIAATGRSTNSISVLKVTGKMTTKDWNYVKNNLPMLEEFDITETDVTTIPENALYESAKLTTVHLPSTAITIGNSAFYNCPSLTIVDGCENVIEIGSSAFRYCQRLSVFPFGNSIQKIESEAFYNCSSLPATLVIPSSLKNLGWSGVFNESSIRSFDLSQCTLTGGFAYNTFGKCTSLLLPENGDYYMGYNTLENAQLTELRLPAALSYIYGGNVFPTTLERLYVSRTEPFNTNGTSAFNNLDLANCTLYVPIGSAEKYKEAQGWSIFTKVEESGFKVNITGYGSVQEGNITYRNGDVFFSSQGSATTLKAIPEEGNTLISVKLDGNDVKVTDGTFTIPATSTVGTLDIAFSANPFTIDNPNGGELKDLIAAMGKNANTINILKVTGKMTTKDWSFVKNSLTSLEVFDISETDAKIVPEEAFQNKDRLTTVHLPSTVISIGNYAFNNCPKLNVIDGWENVKEIGSDAFADCYKLSVFPFGDAIRTIGSGAFRNCSSLPPTLIIPASLTGLGWGGVFNESSIRSFDLSQCTLTESSLGYNTFGKCTSLLLPEKGNYSLGDNALKDAELTELRLPAALSYIYGSSVLPTTLERLYVSRSTPFEVGSNNSFSNIDFDHCTMYVPIGSVDAYANAKYWSDFTNVKEYGLQAVIGEQGKIRAGAQTLMGTTIFFPRENVVTFEIIPNEGWHADAVTLDGTNVSFADNKFTLSSAQLNGKLIVTFAVNQHELQLDITGNGKVKLGSLEYTASQTLTVDNLSTLNFTLEPAAGLAVSSIAFNGKESVLQNGGTNYVTPAITANSTLAITFGAAGAGGNVVTYAVTTSEGGTVEYKNTTLLPETTVQLPKGQDAVFTMKPDQYYKIDVVKLNGEVITDQLNADGSLTLKNVTDDANLEVTFRINAEIAVVMEDGGTLTNLLSDKQKAMVTKLTIKGQMWEKDFYTMRDEMPLLAEIDLWEAETDYIPDRAFCTSSNWDGNSVGCKALTSVRLPERTRTIGDFAFAGCSNLKEVNFTALVNLENMYSEAFQSTNLQVIDLSNTKLTEVGRAFRNVKSLEDIKFPQTLTRLGDVFSQSTLTEIDLSDCTNLKTLEGTFSECKNLVKVTLPESLTTIGGNTFSYCESLTTMKFPKSLVSIGSWAFSYSKIQKVDLSELTELQSIGEYAFYHCQELTEVDLSKTQLKNIPREAFSNCESLESGKMPKTLETIDKYAFVNCYKLGGVLELASTVTNIGDYAFGGTQISVIKSEATVPPSLKENSMPNTWVAAFVPEGYAETYKAAAVWEDKVILDKEVFAEVTVSNEGNLAIDINEQAGIAPALVTHLKVHGPLGVQDFAIMRENMTVLYNLDMEDAQVSVIPENAFNSVKKKVLMNVKLPASLLRIEQNAFYGCSGLDGTLVLPEGLKFIGWGAFQGCSSLDKVVLNDNLEVIQGYAFEGCSSLSQEITLPLDFQSLGESAFANCTSLYGTVKFNRNFYMFMGTEGYGSSAGSCFRNCSNIETVDMSEPDFLDEIPYGTFEGCTSLKTVLLPAMLDRIDNYAFSGCSSLDNIEFPNKLRVINYYAFQNCTSLSSVNLSDCKDLGTIEGYAFYGCSSLETVYLPRNLNWIREYAFAECRKLANLTVEAIQPADLGEYVFRHVHTDRCVLSIPTGTFFDYLSAAQWGEFVSMRKNIDVTVGEGANLYFLNRDNVSAARGIRRAGAVGQEGAKVKDGSSLYVQKDEKAIFMVDPDENVQIAKVLFNGKDVTSEMVNGTYETPGVTDASSFEVMVNVVGDIHVKELRLLDDDVAVKMGENRQLKFAVYPTNATNKAITWTSSDESVAKVNSEGFVTGVAPGRAEITGKTVDGNFEEKCQIVIMSNNYWIVMDNTIEDFVENTVTLPLALHNEGEARDIQFDVYMPTGFSMMNEWSGDFGIQTTGRASGHRVAAARISDEAVRVIVYSQSGNQFQDSDGELLMLPFITGESTGSFDVVIKNIHISGPNNFDFAAPNHTVNFNLKDYPLGDSNGSGDVTINDAVTTVADILNQYNDRFIRRAADVNKDEQITVADVTATVDIVLGRSVPSKAIRKSAADAQGRLYMNDMSMTAGEQQTIGLQMENAADFIAFQCDVYLPAGMKVARNENGKAMVSLSEGIMSNHIISTNVLEDDVLRVVVMSPQNENLSILENNIVNLTVTTDEEMTGESVIDIRNIRLVRNGNSEYVAPDASASVRFGDATGIDNIMAASELKIRVEGHYLIVDASAEAVLQVVSVNGISKNLQIHSGENRFFIENPGVHIINGKKFFIK